MSEIEERNGQCRAERPALLSTYARCGSVTSGRSYTETGIGWNASWSFMAS